MPDRPVAVDGDETTRNESLPFPVVTYPSHYGVFLGFKRDPDGDLYFCACAREAIENYIDCQYESLQDSHRDATPENILNSDFPEETKGIVERAGIEDAHNIVDVLRFKEGLCHECNAVVPNRRYCHEMYGTVFEQNYGWYVFQKSYEYGICTPKSDTLLADTNFERLPGEIVDVVDDDLIENIAEKATRFRELLQKRRGNGSDIETPEKREIDNRVEAIRERYDDRERLPPGEAEEFEQLSQQLKENVEIISDAVMGGGDLPEDIAEALQRQEELKSKRDGIDEDIQQEKRQEIKSVLEEYEDYTWAEEHGELVVVHEGYKDRGELPADEEEELEALREELSENSKRVSDTVENEVRQAVGHYEKGNRWTSETILYQLIESRYGDEYTIERHHRPDWLDGLELDIFLVEAGVGIEYQGVQHYEAVEHWGGEEGLQERQARDERTRELCEEHDVELVEVRHDEELSEELVEERIDPFLPD